MEIDRKILNYYYIFIRVMKIFNKLFVENFKFHFVLLPFHGQ